jgi:F0F1-type ATP synthase assembly protein I
MGRYAHLGFQLAMSMGLFLLAGWWVDGRIGTTPLLTILGAMVGAAAGFYSIIHQLMGRSGRSGTGAADRGQEKEP